MLRCVTAYCSVLQCVVVCCSALQCVTVCCSVVQRVAVCWQCVAVCSNVVQCAQCAAVCCSATPHGMVGLPNVQGSFPLERGLEAELQLSPEEVAVCCSVLQYNAVYCVCFNVL